MPNDALDEELGDLVPDPVLLGELCITRQTAHNWDTHPERAPAEWPAPVYIGKRKHRFRGHIEKLKKSLLVQALAERAKRHQRSEAAAA